VPNNRRQRLKAIVSGQAGIVVVVSRAQTSFRRILTSDYQPCTRKDIPYLFGDASDVISLEETSPERAYRIMEGEWEKDRCLHLLLILLDGTAHLRARRLASQSLENLLHSETTVRFVHHRLYAHQLPGTADLGEATIFAMDEVAKLLWKLLINLKEAQSAIGHVRERWDALDESFFGGFLRKRIFEQIAIEEGFFFDLCSCRPGVGEELVENWLTNPRLKEFDRTGEILSVWTEPFRAPRREVQSVSQLLLFDDQFRHG
jgi:hypothetical protein